MDYLAHGAWSYIIFNKMKPWKAVAAGMAPDTFSWAIFIVYSLFTQGFPSGPPDISLIPNWAFTLYGITHSLVVSFVVLGVVFFVVKPFPKYLLAWPIAVTFDIFTHTRDFLPTPFLWPLSDYAFPGISWSTPWFMITNWALIIGSVLYIRFKLRSASKR